jgi:N-acetyltransferase
MMTPPVIATLADEQVMMRPIRADDHDALFAVAADPAIWTLHPAHDRWQALVFRAFFDESLASRGGMVVIDRADDAIVGHSRFDLLNTEVGEVEIGWTFLARTHWGGASNRAMKRLMLAHAFALGFEAAIFLVGEANWRSRRAMEKIGGTLTDRRHVGDASRRGLVHVIYRIDRAAFARGPLA